MTVEASKASKVYESPMVLNHQPILFETAQSWNRGQGNLDHPGTGNDGINYPLPPYTGPHKGKGN